MSNTPYSSTNFPNLTNNYSGYFLEKSISEIVLNFIKGYNNKTLTSIFFAECFFDIKLCNFISKSIIVYDFIYFCIILYNIYYMNQ